MVRSRFRSTLELGACVVGALAAGAALYGWRVPGGAVPSGAALKVLVDPSTTLAVEPGGVLLHRAWLRPGGTASASVRVRNATGGPLRVRVGAEPQTHDLDQALVLRVDHARDTLFDGSLARLSTVESESFELASHATTTLALGVRVRPGAGYEARAEEIHLHFRTEAPR